MKKIQLLGAMILSAAPAIAQEIKINAGWDFDRAYKNDLTKQQKGLSNINYDYKFKNGPVAGIEWLIDNQGKVEWGIGAEHKFSVKSSTLKDENDMKMFEIAPMYLTGKYNVITSKKGNDLLYLIGRVGYAYARAGEDNKEDFEDKNFRGGLYYAGGIGTQVGPISVEALYERSNLRYEKVDLKNINQNNLSNLNSIKRSKDNINTIGIRVGYSFGRIKNLPKKEKEVEYVLFDRSRTDIFPKSGSATEYSLATLPEKRKWNGGELRLNVGYNFKNKYNVNLSQLSGSSIENDKWYTAKSDFDVKKMPVVGLEYLFDNQGKVELGIGVEQKIYDISGFFNDKDKKHILKAYPVYATTKLNFVNHKGDNLLYVVGRVGYVHGELKEENVDKKDFRGGLYYAGGIGTELGAISVEALYERSNFKYQQENGINPIKNKSKVDTFGIRVGYRIGSTKNKKYNPKIKNPKIGTSYQYTLEDSKIKLENNQNDEVVVLSKNNLKSSENYFEKENEIKTLKKDIENIEDNKNIVEEKTENTIDSIVINNLKTEEL